MPRILTLLFAFATFGPLALWGLAVAGALILAGPVGCTIHEGFPNPCDLWGMDLSNTAYGMGVFAAWGLLLVAPVSLGAGLLWVGAVLVSAIRRKRR